MTPEQWLSVGRRKGDAGPEVGEFAREVYGPVDRIHEPMIGRRARGRTLTAALFADNMMLGKTGVELVDDVSFRLRVRRSDDIDAA